MEAETSPAEYTQELSQDHDNSSPNIIDIHTPIVSTLVDEDNNTERCRDTGEDDSVQLSGLISSLLNATDDLANEIKKDLHLEETLTESLKASAGPIIETDKDDPLKQMSPLAKYLDSFNISLDEKRTAASYVELLQSYQDVFQKWQALEIQSQLKDMKIQDLESKNSELETRIKQLREETRSEKEKSAAFESQIEDVTGRSIRTLHTDKNTQTEDAVYTQDNKPLERDYKRTRREKKNV